MNKVPKLITCHAIYTHLSFSTDFANANMLYNLRDILDQVLRMFFFFFKFQVSWHYGSIKVSKKLQNKGLIQGKFSKKE